MLTLVWDRLAGLLELHAEAEEEICYLAIFGPEPDAAVWMQDAIADHDDIRERCGRRTCTCPALRPSGGQSPPPGGPALTLFAREERGALAASGRRATPALCDELGGQWAPFTVARTRDALPDGREALHRRSRPPGGRVPSGLRAGRLRTS